MVTLTLSDGERLRRVLEEHQWIVEAIGSRDSEAAERAMRPHVREGAAQLRRALDAPPAPEDFVGTRSAPSARGGHRRARAWRH